MARNLFNSIRLNRPKRSKFDLTHDVKLTTKMGRLTPVMAMECVPGDFVRLNGQALIRFAPLVAPIMHRVDVTIHYFFVPNRLLWDNWEKWITGDLEVEAPFINSQAFSSLGPSTLADYLGVPADIVDNVGINALPFAAYQRIWAEYYRDQNLQSEGNTMTSLVNGANDALVSTWTALRNRCWEHDYFTSALPFAQKGPAVDIPLGSVSSDVYIDAPGSTDAQIHLDGQFLPSGTSGYGVAEVREKAGGNTNQLYAEGDVEPTTINDLRTAVKIQQWLERNARAGTRYIESILAHFGVKSDDARLNRPEYITGIKSPVTISEVLNTTGAADAPVQGNMAGHGVNVTDTNRIGKYMCKEHGWLMGIMSVLPKTAYQQGLARKFSKFDRFDYFWPEFAHLGEQAVLNKEIYGAHLNPNSVFGYVPRFSEYKFEPNRVAGDFKSSLNYWHLGRIFSNEPALNASFVTADPSNRVFAVTDGTVDNLYCTVLNRVVASRLMPKFGSPGGL